MDFGIALPTAADSWKLAQRAEELGFTHAWFYDTQMLSADCFVAMGAAAVNTRRIRLGTKGLEQLGTGVVREHEIEQDDVRVPLPHQLQPVAGRVHGPHRVALIAQAGRHCAGQPAVILHERDLPFHRH